MDPLEQVLGIQDTPPAEEEGEFSLDGGNNQPDPSEPSYIAALVDSGADPQVIEEARRATMLQADYTRKRQAEADQVRQMQQAMGQMQQQVAFLSGAAQANPQSKQPQTKAEKLIADMKEQNPEVAQVFEQFLDATREETDMRLRNNLQPLVSQQQQAQFVNAASSLFDEEIASEYGAAAEPLRKELVAKCLQYASQTGIALSPRAYLVNFHPDVALKLHQQKVASTRKQQQDSVLEGFDFGGARPAPLPRPASKPNVPAGPPTANEFVAAFEKYSQNNRARL